MATWFTQYFEGTDPTMPRLDQTFKGGLRQGGRGQDPAMVRFGKDAILSLSTLSLFILAATWFFGWEISVGIAILFLVHEMGHWIAARHFGLDAALPRFIPLVGAFVLLRDDPRDDRERALIALAGPAAGMAASLPFFFYGLTFAKTTALALGGIGLLINMLNLMPFPPFDGGWAVQAVHPSIWFVGLAFVTVLTIYGMAPWWCLLLAAFGLLQIHLWRQERRRTGSKCSDVRTFDRAIVCATYLAVLAVPMWAISEFSPQFWSQFHNI